MRNQQMDRRLTVLALVGVVALGGCGAETADAVPEGVSAAEVSAPVTEAVALTDPQIAHAAVTANAIDVELGELAVSQASTSEVRGFARTMIADHTAVNARAGALAQRLGVTPEANPMSASLLQGADLARGRIEGLSGRDFDRAYLDREVEYHQAVLDALDRTLIPETHNAELKALLMEVRPAIAAHLQHAQALQASLSGS